MGMRSAALAQGGAQGDGAEVRAPARGLCGPLVLLALLSSSRPSPPPWPSRHIFLHPPRPAFSYRAVRPPFGDLTVSVLERTDVYRHDPQEEERSRESELRSRLKRMDY